MYGIDRCIRPGRRWLSAALLLAAACGDGHPVAPRGDTPAPLPAQALVRVDCSVSPARRAVTCGAPADADQRLIGGQGTYVRLTSSNVVVVDVPAPAARDTFSFDVTVQNLLNEAIGTPNGAAPDTAGIQVLFANGPTMTAGAGSVEVGNADGTKVFDGTGTEARPFFRYAQILTKDAVSDHKTWKLAFDPGVESFTFSLLVAAEVQPLLVINEVMVNPLGANGGLSDSDREWFEVYNAGTLRVNLQDMLIADSVASGRRLYHRILSSLVVPAGGYVVLGSSTNTTSNGGVPVDYSYGGAVMLQNSLSALKLSRPYGASDTLTIDRTQFASTAVSAQAGISRELRNPALDNANMDGSNWDNASVISVYGSGGRGTPRAQNSTYTP